MTDVRLTATNPEDSSVVPVACNAKGELLLEELTLPADDYVAKTGDNMTGDLTLGTDKITLDATDGGATFAGVTRIGEPDNADPLSSAATGVRISNNGLVKIKKSAGGSAFSVVDKNNATAAVINASGSATFSNEKIQLLSDGSSLFSGIIRAYSTDAPADFYRKINVNGDLVNFKSDVGETEKVAVKIRTTGAAEFAGDVTVGSRNKSWMLVEQGGLCHMVEQSTASTADLGETVLASAEYPPLRDVFSELNAIETALGEVMEKLRMKPPAGWEVWDGSSENS